MGRKLDALLGRKNFRTPKLKPLLNLSLSRLLVLKNQKQARCSLVQTDIVQLLKLGHHDPALLRVEQVIKEQNMLDVFAMIDSYCHLLADRITLIEQEKGCPEELNEATSSLIYASTRCGEFPELVELRAVFTSRYGKEFVARAIELRNNCGVNPKMIQKLSTRQPSMENRVKVLQDIASGNDIVLQIQEASLLTETEGNIETEQKLNQQPKRESSSSSSMAGGHGFYSFTEEMESPEGSSRKYKDVADAAEAAFKSAAYAASAARAAVELSRSQSHDHPDDRSNSRPRPGPSPGNRDFLTEEEQNAVTSEEISLREAEKKNVRPSLDGEQANQSDFSESNDEVIPSQMIDGNEQGTEMLPEKGLDSISSYTFVDEEHYGSSDDAKLPKSSNNFFLRSEAGLEDDDSEPENAEAHTDGYRRHNAKHVNLQKRPSSVRTRRARGS